MKKAGDIVSRAEIKEYLMKAVETENISHAYLFTGEKGSGKLLLAQFFAEAILCTGQGEKPCGTCKSCVQADSGNQPDIRKIVHEKASIGVDEIREQINQDILIKPYSSKYKIYIMEDADKMTEQAQNALLKTIEEPPEYAVIMLLAENENRLLETIRSRVVKLEVKPVDRETIKQFLMKEKQVPDYLAEESAKFSQGNIGKAIRYAASEDFMELKQNVLHLLRYLSDMTIVEIVEGIKEIGGRKEEVQDILDLMILWYRDVLMCKVTSDPNQLLFKEDFKSLKELARKIDYEGIDQIIEAVDKAKQRLKANVNFDMTMQLLMLTIKENENGTSNRS